MENKTRSVRLVENGPKANISGTICNSSRRPHGCRGYHADALAVFPRRRAHRELFSAKLKVPEYSIICTGRKSWDLSYTSTTGHRTTSVRPPQQSYGCRTPLGRNFWPVRSYSTCTISKVTVRVAYNVRASPLQHLSIRCVNSYAYLTAPVRLPIDGRRPYDYPAVPLQLAHGRLAMGVENTSKGTARAPPNIWMLHMDAADPCDIPDFPTFIWGPVDMWQRQNIWQQG